MESLGKPVAIVSRVPFWDGLLESKRWLMLGIVLQASQDLPNFQAFPCVLPTQALLHPDHASPALSQPLHFPYKNALLTFLCVSNLLSLSLTLLFLCSPIFSLHTLFPPPLILTLSRPVLDYRW